MLKYINKYIAGKRQEVQLVEVGNVNGIHYEIVAFWYKPKDPVFYSFFKGSETQAIVNCLDLLTLRTTNNWLLENYHKGGRLGIGEYEKTGEKTNFTKLKMLKIIR